MNASIADCVAAARHKITVAEARAMAAAEVFGDDVKFELIDGELIFMPDDGGRTINWAAEINRWLVSSLTARPDLVIVPDKTLVLSDHNAPKPDYYVFPASFADPEDVRGPDILIAIEVSDTTLKKDLGPKAALYAAWGVRDYWVIDCDARATLVHRLGPNGYETPVRVDAKDVVRALLIPELALRLDDHPRLR